MRITVTPTEPAGRYPHSTVTIERPGDDLMIEEFAVLCKHAALAFGYHPESVEDHFKE